MFERSSMPGAPGAARQVARWFIRARLRTVIDTLLIIGSTIFVTGAPLGRVASCSVERAGQRRQCCSVHFNIKREHSLERTVNIFSMRCSSLAKSNLPACLRQALQRARNMEVIRVKQTHRAKSNKSTSTFVAFNTSSSVNQVFGRG